MCLLVPLGDSFQNHDVKITKYKTAQFFAFFFFFGNFVKIEK